MNNENLIPINKRAKSVQREIRRKGGLTKAENARRRKEHQERWLALLDIKGEDGLTIRDKLDKALALKASEGDVNAYEKIMEYAGLSVRLSLKEEELQIKSEELKLKKQAAEQAKDAPEDTAASAWSEVLGQIRNVMESDEDGSGS